MVSKSKYWIFENNKGDEYSKTPKKPFNFEYWFCVRYP